MDKEEHANKIKNEKIEGIDRISYLPEFIIHHVMSFLPTKEVAKTSILSKRWQHTQSCYPNLDFDQIYFGRELVIPNYKKVHLLKKFPNIEEKRNKFIRFVEDTLLRFHEKSLWIRKFKLFFTIVDSTTASIVDRWIGLVTERMVEKLDLRFFLPHPTFYTLPQTIFATKSIKVLKLQDNCMFGRGNVRLRFISLQKLSLVFVRVDAQLMENVIASCPLIEVIELKECLGLKKVKILGLNNIKIVDVVQGRDEIETLEIEAPSLHKFCYRVGNSKISPCKFNLIACQNLKWFSLSRVIIADQQFNDLISQFPLLEGLDVIDCNLLQRVKLLNHRLKHIFLQCNKLEVEIDAPNLHSFHYCDNLMPSTVSKSVSRKWKADLKLFPNDRLNSQWFRRMRDFLTKLKHFEVLTLSVYCFEITFNVEEFRGIMLPSIPTLDCVELRLISFSQNYSAFLDGLLWSCCPETLSVEFMELELESRNEFIKVLREKIEHKFYLNCHDLSSIGCWQHDLKKVECYDGDGMPIPWNDLSDKSPNLQKKCPKMHITFVW